MLSYSCNLTAMIISRQFSVDNQLEKKWRDVKYIIGYCTNYKTIITILGLCYKIPNIKSCVETDIFVFWISHLFFPNDHKHYIFDLYSFMFAHVLNHVHDPELFIATITPSATLSVSVCASPHLCRSLRGNESL